MAALQTQEQMQVVAEAVDLVAAQEEALRYLYQAGVVVAAIAMEEMEGQTLL
jgi:hypothetical protein